MKVTVKQQPEEFKPVTLEITLERREELEAMYRLVDFAPEIAQRFRNFRIRGVAEPIYKELRQICLENRIELCSENLENK